jgi:hypothetical protein
MRRGGLVLLGRFASQVRAKPCAIVIPPLMYPTAERVHFLLAWGFLARTVHQTGVGRTCQLGVQRCGFCIHQYAASRNPSVKLILRIGERKPQDGRLRLFRLVRRVSWSSRWHAYHCAGQAYPLAADRPWSACFSAARPRTAAKYSNLPQRSPTSTTLNMWPTLDLDHNDIRIRPIEAGRGSGGSPGERPWPTGWMYLTSEGSNPTYRRGLERRSSNRGITQP